MDADTLKTLLLIARQGSLAGAARVLDTDPSALSRLLAGAEDRLGFRLFHRSTRRLSVTEAGQDYLARIEPLVEALEAARDEAAGADRTPRGHVRLTTSTAFGQVCVLPHLPALRRACPEITLELLLDDAPRDLVADRIDLALRLAPAPRGDLISTRLMRTRYHVCAAPGYLAQHGTPEHPTGLSRHDCLRMALPEYRTRWLFRDTRGATEEVPIDGTLILSGALALREAALLGLGPALLADWLAAEGLASGALVDLFPDHQVTATGFDTGVWALYPDRAHLPARTRAVLDFLRRNLGRGPGCVTKLSPP